jgi:hypothetical protein
MASGELQRTDMSIFTRKAAGSRGGSSRGAGGSKSVRDAIEKLSSTSPTKNAPRSGAYDPVSTGAELLEKLRQKNAEELVAPDRFSGTEKFRDDWGVAGYNNTRTGIGSGGIKSNSGLYMTEEDRFR